MIVNKVHGTRATATSSRRVAEFSLLPVIVVAECRPSH
jgi:hypothetical protein